MARTMALKDGKIEVILREQDFEELVERYMGREAAEYVREMQGEIDDLQDTVELYKEEYGDEPIEQVVR